MSAGPRSSTRSRRASRKVQTFEWLLVHEAAATVARLRDEEAPDVHLRRLFLTVSVRGCRRFAERVILTRPARRYYP
jgi:hypothetical protein